MTAVMTPFKAAALATAAEAKAAVVAQPTNTLGEVLSPSQVRTWMDCQARWMFKYMHQLPEPKNSNLALGCAVHEAIGLNFAQKLESERDLDPEDGKAVFRTAWEAICDETIFRDDESPRELGAQGEQLVGKYLREAAPQIRPAAVEIEVPEGSAIAGVKVQGRIDLLDVDGRVVDLKCVSRRPSGLDPLHAFQLATYVQFVAGASGVVRVDSLVRTKSPQLVQIEERLTRSDFLATERLYPLAQEGMRAGYYMPNRGSNLCSRRNCAYWRHCEAEFGGRVEES